MQVPSLDLAYACDATEAGGTGAFAHALTWTLAHSLWIGASAALCLGAILCLLHSRFARWRYAASGGALISIPLLALWTLGRDLRADPLELPALLEGAKDGSALEMFFSALVARADLLRMGLAQLLEPLEIWIAGGWIGLSFLAFARFGGGWTLLKLESTWRMRRASPTQQARVARLARRIGLRRRVHLYWSDRAEVPMVIGALRPRILVPARLQVPVEQGELDLVLLHELAHVRRGDAWVRTLEAMVAALFVVNPFMRWIVSRLAREREHCCDDIALGAGADRLRYVRALTALELERSTQERRARSLEWRFANATALHATDGALLERVRRLTGASKPAPPLRLAAACVGAFLGSAGLTFGALPTHDARVVVAFHADARAPFEIRMTEEPVQGAWAPARFAVHGPPMGQRKARVMFVARHSESGEADTARFLLADESENLRVRWLEDEDEDETGSVKNRLIRVEAFRSVR